MEAMWIPGWPWQAWWSDSEQEVCFIVLSHWNVNTVSMATKASLPWLKLGLKITFIFPLPQHSSDKFFFRPTRWNLCTDRQLQAHFWSFPQLLNLVHFTSVIPHVCFSLPTPSVFTLGQECDTCGWGDDSKLPWSSFLLSYTYLLK